MTKWPEKRRTCKICDGVGWWAEQTGEFEQEQRQCPDCDMGETEDDVKFNEALDQARQAVEEAVSVERMAEGCHTMWSNWMKYVWKCSKRVNGQVIIPQGLVERWERQMNTEYENLPENEKESDRIEATAIRKQILTELFGGEDVKP